MTASIQLPPAPSPAGIGRHHLARGTLPPAATAPSVTTCRPSGNSARYRQPCLPATGPGALQVATEPSQIDIWLRPAQPRQALYRPKP